MDKVALKAFIEQEITKTQALVAEYRELSQPIAPDAAIGRISRMDAINNKTISEAALRAAENKLHALEHSLGQLDSPDFGICKKCGQPIPVGRIVIKPESPYCVRCA